MQSSIDLESIKSQSKGLEGYVPLQMAMLGTNLTSGNKIFIIEDKSETHVKLAQGDMSIK